MPMEVYDHTGSPYLIAAEGFLRQALSDVESGYDAIPAVSGALAALRVEAHEQPADNELLELGLEYHRHWTRQ